tara:strand:- start:152 stop:523 length:372 start_codon:yes stop_codon:yes gene_type:complete
MIFFSWPKIKKYSNGNVQIIKAIYQSMMDDNRPSFARRRYDEIDFSGDSYLLKPDKLLRAFHNANQVDAANYLMLASRRSYADYLVTGDFTLPLKHIAIPQTKLEKNSLLEIVGTDIHFILEK